MPVTTGTPQPCVSCKRDATHLCDAKVRLLRKCNAPLCDDCGHFNDKREPVHDRLMADRSHNKFTAERQAEELLAIEDEMASELDAVRGVARDIAGAKAAARKPSRRELARTRDDLVDLLEELREPQTVVLDGVKPEERR